MIYGMAQSESVQYFQFDRQGNRYIYEPGAGCSGPCVKVGPGFQLSDISQVNVFSSNATEIVSSTEVNHDVMHLGTKVSPNLFEPTQP